MQPNNSNAENQPQFELPNFREGLERQTEKGHEKSADKESELGKSSPGSVLGAQPAVPDLSGVQVPTTVLPVDDQAASGTLAIPLSPAADTDHIEKEWVMKAKTIIARTRDDPHEQKKELSKVKAEYIKKTLW